MRVCYQCCSIMPLWNTMCNETHTLLWQCGYGTLHLKIISGLFLYWLVINVEPDCKLNSWFIQLVLLHLMQPCIKDVFFKSGKVWRGGGLQNIFSPSNARHPCRYQSQCMGEVCTLRNRNTDTAYMSFLKEYLTAAARTREKITHPSCSATLFWKAIRFLGTRRLLHFAVLT